MNPTERLLKICDADPGFYLVGLHSCVEDTVLRLEPGIQETIFWRILAEYKDILIARAGGAWIKDLKYVDSIIREHRHTNEVRHRFAELTRDEAHT
jgi:hypothetical protein